jgi:hypothetical protein
MRQTLTNGRGDVLSVQTSRGSLTGDRMPSSAVRSFSDADEYAATTCHGNFMRGRFRERFAMP